MNERGKHYKRPTGCAPYDPQTPEIQPLSHRENTTSEPVNKDIQAVRRSTRSAAVMSIAWMGLLGGAGGTVGYMYLTEQGPFAPQEKQTETILSSNTEEPDAEPEIPAEIRTEKDLLDALRGLKIKAEAKDFNFEGLGTHQARAILFVPDENMQKGTSDLGYQWKPLLEKITTIEQEKEIKDVIVAVRVINPVFLKNMEDDLQPGGFPWRTRARDTDDPSIMYFYYNCEDKKHDPLLARIGIPIPGKQDKFFWFRSFNIPKCQKKDPNGVESDAQIQK